MALFFRQLSSILLGTFFAGVLLTSCYDDAIIVPVYENNIFSFIMPDSTVDNILDSRGSKVYIDDLESLTYGNYPFEVERLNTRGGGTLNFQRKSFSVNLNQFLPLYTQTGEKKTFKKFKLLAMQFDYTYIENRVAQVMLNEIGLWPLHTFYTELKLNSLHQGLYMFVEDPEEHLISVKSADVVIRRYYRGEIDKIKLKDKTSTKSEFYENEFQKIYQTLIEHEGKELYDVLKIQMNIDAYMQKMALDLIVENGDYTDEIYFFGIERNGSVYFDILPWDYDDLFQGIPHEVGRDWAVGQLFGVRKYPNHEAVLNSLNGRLVFSIEDDIDYRIATDDYLYQKYVENMKLVLDKLSPEKVEMLFGQVFDELAPFYDVVEVVEQSKFDANRTSKEIFTQNIHNKMLNLKYRVEWLKGIIYEE